MKQEQPSPNNPQELVKKEDFVVTVLQKTGQRFFEKANIQNLKVRQREIFKGIPSTSQPALDKMLDGVMTKLRIKHDQQIRLLIRQNPRYKIMKIRQKDLRQCFFKIEYKYDRMSQTFKQKYKHHIVQVINHIHNNISRTNFLSDYKVLKELKPPAFKLKVKVKMGDSDFVYKSKNNDAFLKDLSAEQVMYWMWSFAHMIDEMESIGVYHQDLKPSNTIKLGRIFQCIDFEYSILVDDQKTKQNIKEMLKPFKDPQAIIFANMTAQSQSFTCKKLKDKDKQFKIEDYKRKDQEILKIYNSLLQRFQAIKTKIEEYIPNNLDDAYECFKDYLKVYHKISFLRCLLDVSQITSNMGTLQIKDENNIVKIDKEQEILQIIKNELDFSGKPNVYHQFIKAIEQKNPYLALKQSITLQYIQQLKKSKEVPNNIKQIATKKHTSFIASLKEDFWFLEPIIQDSMTEKEISCRVRNSCTFFETPRDFWKLNKPRYLHYLFVSAKSALDLLEYANIYLTHLSIKDFSKEGQFFLIRTLENALMLTTSQQKHNVQKLSREFIQQLVKVGNESTSNIVSLNAIYKTNWFMDIKKTEKLSLDKKDYTDLIAFLKENKQKMLLGLMKQLFDQIEDPIIKLEKEDYKKLLLNIKEMIDEAKQTDDIQKIFALFKEIQTEYPGQSFAGIFQQQSSSDVQS